jgi:chitinase
MNNATFAVGAAIAIAAQASDADGVLARVEFYDGAEKLGEDATAPFQFTWANAPAGNHRLIARAIDTLGGTQDSVTVNVAVGASSPVTLAGTRLANGAIRLAITAPAGNYTVQDSIDLRSWIDAFPVVIGGTGAGSVDDTRAPRAEGRLFYRLRKN